MGMGEGHRLAVLLHLPAQHAAGQRVEADLLAVGRGNPAIGIGGISQVVDHLEPGARLGGAVRARDAQLDTRGLAGHGVQQIEVAAPVLVLCIGKDVIQLHCRPRVHPPPAARSWR